MLQETAPSLGRFTMPYYQKRLFDPETLECLLPQVVHPTLEPPQIHALLTPEEIYKLADQSLLESLKEDKRLERKPDGSPQGTPDRSFLALCGQFSLAHFKVYHYPDSGRPPSLSAG